MSSLNRIIIIGSVSTDPEHQVTSEGVNYVKFSLSVERPTSEGAPEKQDIMDIIGWRTAAENAKTVTKGSTVLVEGRIINRTYDDNEGQRHYVTEIGAKQITPLAAGASLASEPTVEVKENSGVTEAAFEFNNSEAPAGASEDIPF